MVGVEAEADRRRAAVVVEADLHRVEAGAVVPARALVVVGVVEAADRIQPHRLTDSCD